MLGTTIYLNSEKLDLFKDETIELNSSVQNINDISKTFTDYSQSFTVPASDNNNRLFQHYYNTDVDGTFNANIRQSGYIELGSLPFRFGTIQLEDVKLKNLQPYAYTIRFYGAVVNLSDLFLDDELKVLDFSAFNHQYNANILDATYTESINNGDVYYPLITSLRNYEVGTANTNDITTVGGQVVYSELKPALRLNRIIDAIEVKYGVIFDRYFLNRAVFDNLFMWLHNNANGLTVSEVGQRIELTNTTGFSAIDVVINTTNDTLETQQIATVYTNNRINVKITPSAGFTTIPYSVKIFNSLDQVVGSRENVQGTNTATFITSKEDTFYFKIFSNSTFTFTPTIAVSRQIFPSGTIVANSKIQAQQTILGLINISDNLPAIKVKDFITSIIKMFNLVLIPINTRQFRLLPLDDWYAQGKLIDLSKYVDTKDVIVKKPKLFKRIEFKHQKSGQILNEQFRNNNGLELGYGDLRTDYAIDGGELKIETQFDNLMFERLQNRATDDITNVQVGKSIDKTLQPYIGKPYIFYRNGFTFYDIPIKVKDHADISYSWQTGTENDLFIDQVSNTVNFSTDISTFLFSEINRNLFSNYWFDYISDLYSLKRRIQNYTAYLPTGVLINLDLNDVVKIGDKAYIINSMRPNLSTGKTDFELLNYIGKPLNSLNNVVYFTADTIDYSADSELESADMISFYTPQYSSIVNGVEYTSLSVTPSAQNYDCKITANQLYTVIKVDTGDGVGWINLENSNDIRTNVLKIKVDKYVSAITNDTLLRSMDLEITIDTDIFTITITQGQL